MTNDLMMAPFQPADRQRHDGQFVAKLALSDGDKITTAADHLALQHRWVIARAA